MSSPLFMRDVSLKLSLVSAGTYVEYNCDVSTAEIVPTPGDEVTYSTLCPEGSYSSRGKTTYALHLVAAQRWDAADGLAAFLWDHDGELANFQYQAHGDSVIPSASAPGMAGEVVLVAGTYGGAVDEFAELDVTLACSSKPTKIVAAFPAIEEAGLGGPSIEDVETAVDAGAITGEEATQLEAMTS
jgi:hypothetical protein